MSLKNEKPVHNSGFEQNIFTSLFCVVHIMLLFLLNVVVFYLLYSEKNEEKTPFEPHTKKYKRHKG